MAMGRVVTLAVTALIRPERTWAAIRQGDDPPTLSLIMVFPLFFSMLPLCGRALGHLLLDWPLTSLLLDGFLYSAFCLLLVLGLGLALGAVAPIVDGMDDRAAAFHLAMYASTPIWVVGLLHVVPVATLHTVFPFVGLLWTGWLLLSGAYEVLDVRPDRALVPLGLLFAVFTGGYVLLNQVLLIHVFIRG